MRAPGVSRTAAADLVQRRRRGSPARQRHPLVQAGREVELAAHGPLGDRGDLLGAAPACVGEQLDDLVLDQGRVDVHDDEPAAAPGQAGGRDGDVDAVRGRGLGDSSRRRTSTSSTGDVELDGA